MDLGLLQRAVAEEIGCSTDTLLLWEKGRSEPEIRFWPGVIQFLGYDPLPPGKTVAERLRAVRRIKGWSQKRLAKVVGVDQGIGDCFSVGRDGGSGHCLSRLLGRRFVGCGGLPATCESGVSARWRTCAAIMIG